MRRNVNYKPPFPWFSKFWDEINGKGSWDLNPWLWVVSFKRLEPTP